MFRSGIHEPDAARRTTAAPPVDRPGRRTCVGRLPKFAISSAKPSRTPLKSSSVRGAIARGRRQSRQDAVAHFDRRAAHSRRRARSTTDGCARRPGLSITCCPNLRRAMPSRAISGCPRSGRRCCGARDRSRSPAAGRAPRGGRSSARATARTARNASVRAAGRPVSGMRTAMIASQAFAEASRWLTGQMPQIRAVIDGIS